MHVFITGKKQIGKTTLARHIANIFDGEVHGFFSQRIENLTGCTVELCSLAQNSPKHRIGEMQNGQAFCPHPEVLDSAGVEILQKITPKTQGLILMDEIGFIESNAPVFKQEIERILGLGLPVLAVLRMADTPFLLSLFTRPDVFLVTLTLENRNELLDVCLQELGII